MIRAFIAVELPDDVRAALGEVQDRLKRAHVGVKVSWTKLANIHLTLQFLGYVPEEKIAVISAALAAVAGNHAPFSVPVGGVGGFPDVNRPRVLWVGCHDTAGKLTALAGAVRACGFATAEREFAAHLTLGRIKWPRPDAALTKVVDSLRDGACGILPVTEIHLFQSQLQPQGSVYTKLSSHQLK
jgi:2'-5' RNA ligase